MDTNEFDDSLDGSITKPTINPLVLDKTEQPPRKPTRGQNMVEVGIITEDKILKIIEKEKSVTAYLISKKYNIPDRTAGNALTRMKKKGILIDTYEMLLSNDKRHRLHHVFRLVKKNG